MIVRNVRLSNRIIPFKHRKLITPCLTLCATTHTDWQDTGKFFLNIFVGFALKNNEQWQFSSIHSNRCTQCKPHCGRNTDTYRDSTFPLLAESAIWRAILINGCLIYIHQVTQVIDILLIRAHQSGIVVLPYRLRSCIQNLLHKSPGTNIQSSTVNKFEDPITLLLVVVIFQCRAY